jgi:riboflavin kinase/FMN adenylyltransferase
MRVVRGGGRPAELPRGAVVTVGNFDGVHRGQRAILDATVERARALGAFAALVTFDPHPLEVLAPGRAPARISSAAQRLRLLEAAGIDEVWVVPFTPEFSRLDPAEFVAAILVAGLGAREVHVGSRFAFGRGREGDLRRLEALGGAHGFAAVGHAELLQGGAPISSTRVREAVAAGEIELAAELLGRPFAVAGRVARGDRVGHRLGWPTANVAVEGGLLPANGVYVTRSNLPASGASLAGVTNVGVRPTRDGSAVVRVEAHLFDFERELYGEELEVAFLARLRAERKFPSLEALRAQIAADAAAAREYFRREARSPDDAGAAPRTGAPPTDRPTSRERTSPDGQ